MSTVYNFADGYNPSGKSTYDIWKDAGNTGETTDFLEFIKLGAKGEQGLQGVQGPDGKSEYELWLEQEGNEGKSEEEFLNRETEIIYMRDCINGLIYSGKIVDGKLTFKIVPVMKVTKTPDIMRYITGEKFDPVGMVVTYIFEDGSKKEISGYTYTEIVDDTGIITITYTEDDIIFTTTLKVKIVDTIEDKLIDFTYTVNEDGTYTLETWKCTLNGVPSTEIVVPNDPKIEI